MTRLDHIWSLTGSEEQAAPSYRQKFETLQLKLSWWALNSDSLNSNIARDVKAAQCHSLSVLSFVFNKNVIISQHLNFSRRRASQLLNFHCHCRQAHQTENKIILSKIFKMANNLFFYNFSYLCLCHCHCHCHFLCHCAGLYIIK